MTYSRGKKFYNNFIKSLIWIPEWPEGVNIIFKVLKVPGCHHLFNGKRSKKKKKPMVLLVNKNSFSPKIVFRRFLK